MSSALADFENPNGGRNAGPLGFTRISTLAAQGGHMSSVIQGGLQVSPEPERYPTWISDLVLDTTGGACLSSVESHVPAGEFIWEVSAWV